jgi:K+-transporting ATPase ATPase C chain
VDLVTTSASRLDPEIFPAAAEFQIPRVAWSVACLSPRLRDLVQKRTHQRDLGLFGEPRVNVLEINLALDDLVLGALARSDPAASPLPAKAKVPHGR